LKHADVPLSMRSLWRKLGKKPWDPRLGDWL
jgi:hypothetical protein